MHSLWLSFEGQNLCVTERCSNVSYASNLLVPTKEQFPKKKSFQSLLVVVKIMLNTILGCELQSPCVIERLSIALLCQEPFSNN